MNSRLAALDFICACLGDDADPQQNIALRSTARSGHLHWPTVIQIANDHLVSPALWVALRARGLTNDLSTDVGEYLSELHRLNCVRNEGLRSQVIEAGRALNAISVVPLLLKGAATLLSNTHDDPGYRVMRDLDLLVPEPQAKVCWHALRRLGYQPTSVHNGLKIAQAAPRDFERHHHLHALHRTGDYATVEIHKASLPQPHGQLLPNEPLLGNATCIEADGIALLVPAPSDSVLHALVHALLVDRAHARGLIPIRLLHDMLRMQRHFGDRVDWDIIRRCFCQILQEEILDDTLYLGRRLFHFTTGAGIHESLPTRLHFIRTRTQVRWPWADALAARALCFSTEDICARYQCDRRHMIVNAMRARFLSSILAGKFYKVANRIRDRGVG